EAGLGALGAFSRYRPPQEIPIKQGEVIPPRELPPYQPRRLEAGPRFVSGPAGIAEYGRTYPLDIGGVELPQGELGAVLPKETGEVGRLSAEDAARLGLRAGAGEIGKINLPKKGEVINLNELDRRIKAATERPTQIGESPEYNIGRVGQFEQESAPIKPSRIKPKEPSQESVKITQPEAGKGEVIEGEVLGEKPSASA